MDRGARPLHIGTAGWSVPRAATPAFLEAGGQLQRHASVLNRAEINTTFQRSHRTEVYARHEQGPALNQAGESSQGISARR